MGRWEPNARGRLGEAAMGLYLERGFEQTTVAEIASRAGLTERTFFRHFADKREVLFAGSVALQELFVSSLAEALADRCPIAAVEAAVAAASATMASREASAARQSVISANLELQERELMKLASLSAALARTLRDHGVEEPAASLLGEAGIAVFKVAFERWLDEGHDQSLTELVHRGFATLALSFGDRSFGDRDPAAAPERAAGVAAQTAV